MFKQFKNYLGKIYEKNNLHTQKSYFMDIGEASWNRRDYKAFANDAYIKNVVAHKAINLICRSASSVEIIVKGKGKATEDIISQLLRSPNPKESQTELFYSLYAYKLINGNAFLLAGSSSKRSKPHELYCLRPDRIKLETNEHFVPNCYIYSTGRYNIKYKVDQVTGFSQILQLKNFHPLDDFHGLSSIEAAAYSIDQHNQAAAWNQSLLQNGARPSGAIVVNNKDSGHRLTDEQFSRLKSMVNDVYSGTRNSGKPMVLEGGLEWREMSLSPKDMDFIECKNSAARDIALAFGVPPQLLGIPGDNTYSNLKEARIAFWEQTVLPITQGVLEKIGNWLSQMFDQEIKLSYSIDTIPVFAAQRESMWEKVKGADFLSNEEKKKLLGL